MSLTDTTHTIFKSAQRFFSGTALSRISGMLRDISMAYVFGTQVSIASFMLAFRFAHLARRLFGEGALQSAFIPEFESLRHHTPEKAFQFFCDLKVVLMLFLSLFILLGCGALGIIFSYGHFSADNQEVIILTLLMLPSLFFICLYGLNASLLQCEKNYFTSAVAPVGFNVIQICSIIALYYFQPKEAMRWLAGGVIIACFFQWVITMPRVLSILNKNLTTRLWKNLNPFSPALLKFIKPLFLGMLGVAASQINNAVDALFGRIAEAEGPAFLWYSIRVQQLPLALFGIAISGAILPPLSRAIKALDWTKYNYFITYALQKTLLFMLPITFFILAVGDTSINLIYGRGDFGGHSIVGVTYCLWAYGLGLLPMALTLILAPACYAQSNYRSPAIASFLVIGLNTILNAWFIFSWGLGAMSVACATSISAWVNAFFLSRTLSHSTGTVWTWDIMKSLGKIGLATWIAFLGVILGRLASQDLTLTLLLTRQIPDFSQHFLEQFFAFIWQGGLFGFLFITSAYMFGILNTRSEGFQDSQHAEYIS